ncbi:MAG TPA: putative sugar nucleotidyl transferase [Planctomycetota bacterium]|nr:putative sugar nucleotidyl transferase [Planctomycetota bacterium]HRR82394.1 putative sugar nucleotidyl transferase [Planctomycetota bacterium]HRT95740.1 putative sugar nucleotidyl transferase [Planctomycetota bacterium]
MRLIIFEDDTFDNFYPLTYLRAAFELRCGATTLAEKIHRAAPYAQVAYFTRDVLAPVLRQRLRAPVNDPASLRGDDLLLINGRCLLLDAAQLPVEGPEETLTCSGALLGARVRRATAEAAAAATPKDLLGALPPAAPAREVGAILLRFPWELIHHNAAAIVADFKAAGRAGIVGTFSDHATVWGSKEQVFVAPTAEVQPFVCIDTTHGPVTIDDGAVVHPHTRVEGPCYIGHGSILVGGKIREGCSIGPVCRVGGEVEESIIHGYSNKYHDGFLGHAYVCEWVNLGALTTNSDLKNDYSSVQVYFKGELVDTGDTKVGSFIGDHTKTSIGTILNTGTVVGVMCNIMASGGVTPKFIPSFTMFLDNKMYNIPFKKTLETARTAMSRRKRQLTEAEVAALESAVGLTKAERDDLVRRSRKLLARERGLTD